MKQKDFEVFTFLQWPFQLEGWRFSIKCFCAKDEGHIFNIVKQNQIIPKWGCEKQLTKRDTANNKQISFPLKLFSLNKSFCRWVIETLYYIDTANCIINIYMNLFGRYGLRSGFTYKNVYYLKNETCDLHAAIKPFAQMVCKSAWWP